VRFQYYSIPLGYYPLPRLKKAITHSAILFPVDATMDDILVLYL